MKQALNFLSQVSQALIIPVGLLCWFSIKQEIRANRLESEAAAKDAYVLKSDYAAMIGQLNATDQKLADLLQSERLDIQHVTDMVASRRESYSSKNNNSN